MVNVSSDAHILKWFLLQKLLEMRLGSRWKLQDSDGYVGLSCGASITSRQLFGGYISLLTSRSILRLLPQSEI